ncbi:MAG: FAD:protein FMN transferase [Pseudomonadota bacterium]
MNPLTRRTCLAAGLLLPWLPAASSPAVQTLKSSRALMGTAVDIVVQGAEPAALAAAVEAAHAEMSRLEGLMSRYRGTSLVSALHLASGLQPVSMAPEAMSVLRQARRVSLDSEGAFDATIGAYSGWGFAPHQANMPAPAEIARERPLVDFRDLVLDEQANTAFLRRRGMRVDLGGIAKLPILEAGMGVLRRHGVRHAMVNGGGDVGVMGGSAAGPWRIGVRDPRAPARLLGVLALRDGWVASSGDYERCFERDGRRYHHILDPRSGYPTAGPRGVVLVAGQAEAVNGLGAATMVLGWRRSQALLAGRAALAVERDGAIRTTAAWSRQPFTAARSL